MDNGQDIDPCGREVIDDPIGTFNNFTDLL
jgi:hypothetical protein